MISEAVHHLRCALDHLIYNLAWLDSGREREHTAFPCVQAAVEEDAESKWSNAARNYLRGVNATHREMIRVHQPDPVGSGDWLARLVVLSNHDKHRLPVHVGAMHEVTSWPHRAYPHPDNPDMIIQPYSDLEFYIGLPDGSNALSGLRDAAHAVDLCLEGFALDF